MIPMLELERPYRMQLEGKNGVILGVANRYSIAWGIARAAAQAGARLAFNYQNERTEQGVKKLLAAEMPDAVCLPCNVTNDEEIARFFEKIGNHFGGQLHFLVHSIAFARKEELAGRFADTSRAGFALAMDVSVFSLVAAARCARPLMEAADGGSVLTLSYFGAEKVVRNYNVMGVAKAALEASVRYLAADLGPDGVRVNAISAGPIKTLAARGITGFSDMLGLAAERAPLRRNVEAGEVGQAAVFLASDAARGITGEILYVDAGYNIMGL